MDGSSTINELKDRGTGVPAPDAVVRLYHEAFARFGTVALWSWKAQAWPTITQSLAVADSLRAEGNLQARALAAQIEQACRAAF